MVKKFLNALRNPPSWKSLFIFYTLFIFFIVQVAIFENEIIDDLIKENYQLQSDLDLADEMIYELSDLAAEQNNFILDEKQKPLINLNICDENLGLYEPYEFVIQYSFPNGPEFSI